MCRVIDKHGGELPFAARGSKVRGAQEVDGRHESGLKLLLLDKAK